MWFEYRHGISAYLSLVTGPIAPFNDKASDMARYFHSLGLYFSCQIRSAATLNLAAMHTDSSLGRLSPVRDSHGATKDVEPSFTATEKRS
jgi:hypothetical protein